MKLFANKNKLTNQKTLLTLSTCWYVLKSKFDAITYMDWINNLLSIVNNFNLVIYTDADSIKLIMPLLNRRNPKIVIIIKPIEDFHTYKYKEQWINNHSTSNLDLHAKTEWKLNMLWNEKPFFVDETIKNKYFDTPYYGWCDIGYFRNRSNDMHTDNLKNWPNNNTLMSNMSVKSGIHYSCVQHNSILYMRMFNDIKNHYTNKLTTQPCKILFDTTCFAGGFFLIKPNYIDIYTKIYDEKLLYYFTNNYIIKDDQTIIMDIIFTNLELFHIYMEENKWFDNWFMFQRVLL